MRQKYILVLLWAAAFLGLGGVFSAPAQDSYRVPYRPHSVQDQAWQMTVDSGTLAHAAITQRYRVLSQKEETLRNLDNLHQAALRLYEELSRPVVDVAGTVDVYLVLRRAYDQARPSFDVLDDTGPVRTAVWRFRDTIRDVARYYYHQVAVPLAKGPAPPEPPVVDWKLRQTAADLARLSGRLASQARQIQLLGEVSRGAAERMMELGDAAEQFYIRVLKVGADPALLARDYRSLVLRMQGARDVAGDFKLDFQISLGTIWHQAEQLGYLSPETTLGAYHLSDFNTSQSFLTR